MADEYKSLKLPEKSGDFILAKHKPVICLKAALENSTRFDNEVFKFNHQTRFSVQFLTLIIILISEQSQILAKQPVSASALSIRRHLT